MKSKYIFDVSDYDFLDSNRCNACAKPRTDTIKSLMDNGFFPFLINSTKFGKLNKISKFLLSCEVIVRGLFIHKAFIVVQYPFIGLPQAVIKIIVKILKRYNRIVVLIHDIENIRQGNHVLKNLDQFILENADCCILHSNNMIKKIKEDGINIKQAVSIEFFDYRSVTDISQPVALGLDKQVCNTVPEALRNIRLIFAGNLQKSKFLKYLDRIDFSDKFSINLYGNKPDSIKINKYISYKGFFDAEQIDKIEGNWGLVWDGDSIKNCTGLLGKYLKYNAPFKLSLYLAAKRPVIVWSGSAMTEYVKKYDIGVCVDSLEDIPKVVAKLTDQQLLKITSNVEKVSKEVRTGKKLLNALKTIKNK